MATASSTSNTSTPYRIGVELRIRRHIPPDQWEARKRPIPPFDDGSSVDRISYALGNPPLETQPPDDQREHTFTITGSKTLRRLDSDGGGGAQVLTGHFNRIKTYECLAKIYDSVYYPLHDKDSGWDCSTLADVDYATEAWAYETMQRVKGVGGELVPKYFGTWSFAIAQRKHDRSRWVRMLLLELVPGETVLAKILRATKNNSIQRSLLPDEESRLQVLKNTFEANIWIRWKARVDQGDLAPRNIMVCPNSSSVVLIDFNQASPYHVTTDVGTCSLPPSPIHVYWPFAPGTGSFADKNNPWASWVPVNWLAKPELAAQWLLETWGDDASNKYAPLSDFFLNHPAHAERNEDIQAALERLGRRPARKPSGTHR